MHLLPPPLSLALTSTLRSTSARRSSHDPPSNPGLTLDPVVSHFSQGSSRRRSRRASSPTVVLPPALRTYLRTPRRIRAQITNSSVPFPRCLPPSPYVPSLTIFSLP